MAGCWLVLIAGVAGVIAHRLGGGAAGDRAVVAVAVVGGDPVVGARGRGGVARRGGRAADERLGVGEQRRAGAVRVVVEVEGDRAGRVVAAADRRLVGDRGADRGGGRLLAGGDRRGGLRDGDSVFRTDRRVPVRGLAWPVNRKRGTGKRIEPGGPSVTPAGIGLA